LVIAVPFSWCSWRITRDLPAGRAPAGDRHLNFYESRDNVDPPSTAQTTARGTPTAKVLQRKPGDVTIDDLDLAARDAWVQAEAEEDTGQPGDDAERSGEAGCGGRTPAD